MEKDYEALGRYTDAREKIKKLVQQRNAILTSLANALQMAARDSGPLDLSDLDGEHAGRVLAEARELHRQLLELVHEANIYADRAGETRFKIHGNARR